MHSSIQYTYTTVCPLCTHTLLLGPTHTPTHTHVLTHVAAIQAHSELFLLDARKEKCIQARVSFPFPPFSLSQYFFAFSFFFYCSISPPCSLAYSASLAVVVLSLQDLTVAGSPDDLAPYNMHSRRSVIQSVIYSYTHDWHSLSHPHSLTRCLFIHSLQWRCSLLVVLLVAHFGFS